MAILTLAEWKTLTGTTGTTYDTQVTALIPYIESDFIAMCNYDFGVGTEDEAFPDGCKLYAAQMVTYQLRTFGSDGDTKRSESIGDYSYTRDKTGEYGYPAPLEKLITLKWRRASFKSGTVQDQYRDKRGLTPQSLAR